MKSKAAAAAEEEDKGYVARVEAQSIVLLPTYQTCWMMISCRIFIFDRALPPATFRNNVFRTGDLTSAL